MKFIIYAALCVFMLVMFLRFVSDAQEPDFEAMMEAEPRGAGVVACRPSYFKLCP